MLDENSIPIEELMLAPEPAATPEFLKKMGEDNAELASVLKLRAAEWTEHIDELSGMEGLGAEILKDIEYISKEEVDSHLNNVAAEVQEILTTQPNKKITFLTHRTDGGSQVWMFNEIAERLGEDLSRNLELTDDYPDLNEIYQDDLNPTFFFLDDSINSGKQFADAGRKLMPIEVHATGVVDFRVRCLRINPNGIDAQRTIGMLDRVSSIDVSTTASYEVNAPMKTTADVKQRLGIQDEDINNAGLIFKTSQATREDATLAVFWHKVQDNMSPTMIDKNRVNWSLIQKED